MLSKRVIVLVFQVCLGPRETRSLECTISAVTTGRSHVDRVKVDVPPRLLDEARG